MFDRMAASRAQLVLSLVLSLGLGAHGACVPNTTSTTDLQASLTSGGANYTLSLCAGSTYTLDDVLNMTAPGQVSHCAHHGGFTPFLCPLTALTRRRRSPPRGTRGTTRARRWLSLV